MGGRAKRLEFSRLGNGEENPAAEHPAVVSAGWSVFFGEVATF
jgi:hypothetical protein